MISGSWKSIAQAQWNEHFQITHRDILMKPPLAVSDNEDELREKDAAQAQTR